MLTALLIDGTDKPVALRTDDSDALPDVRGERREGHQRFITWGGYYGKAPRTFEYVREEKGEGGTVLFYRPADGKLSAETFERSAGEQGDYHLNPSKWRKVGNEPGDRKAPAKAAAK